MVFTSKQVKSVLIGLLFAQTMHGQAWSLQWLKDKAQSLQKTTLKERIIIGAALTALAVGVYYLFKSSDSDIPNITDSELFKKHGLEEVITSLSNRECVLKTMGSTGWKSVMIENQPVLVSANNTCILLPDATNKKALMIQVVQEATSSTLTVHTFTTKLHEENANIAHEEFVTKDTLGFSSALIKKALEQIGFSEIPESDKPRSFQQEKPQPTTETITVAPQATPEPKKLMPTSHKPTETPITLHAETQHTQRPQTTSPVTPVAEPVQLPTVTPEPTEKPNNSIDPKTKSVFKKLLQDVKTLTTADQPTPPAQAPTNNVAEELVQTLKEKTNAASKLKAIGVSTETETRTLEQASTEELEAYAQKITAAKKKLKEAHNALLNATGQPKESQQALYNAVQTYKVLTKENQAIAKIIKQRTEQSDLIITENTLTGSIGNLDDQTLWNGLLATVANSQIINNRQYCAATKTIYDPATNILIQVQQGKAYRMKNNALETNVILNNQQYLTNITTMLRGIIKNEKTLILSWIRETKQQVHSYMQEMKEKKAAQKE